MEELLKGLGIEERIIQNILKGMNDNKIFTTKEEKIEERYNKMKLERDDLKEKLSKADDTITALKNANKDNETLQTTIKTHEATIETMKKDYDSKIREMAIKNAIQGKLTDTKYPELLETKFDKTKLSISEDGTVLGIDEQLASLKESYKDLFAPKIEGRDPNNNGGGKPSINNPWSKEHFNLTMQAKILKDNPELAKQLKNSI